MARYIINRIIMMIITLFTITLITFFLMHSIPGNPLADTARKLPPQTLANYKARYGLDKPIHEQFFIFVKNLVTEGDLGESLKYPGRSISETIKTTAPISGQIGLISLAIGVLIGVTLGVIAALNRNRWPDYLVIFIAMIGVTIPVFVLAAMLQYFLANKLRLLPVSGWETSKNMIMPIVAMCFGPIATYARYTRSNVLEVLGQDYILTAEAKGVPRMKILTRHVFRNAMLPLITILGPQIAGVFTGSFIVEKMFSIPGLGTYFVTSINVRDYTMIIGTTIFYAGLFIISQLVVDIVYGLVDPRIRVSE